LGALKGKAGVKVGVQYGGLITDAKLRITLKPPKPKAIFSCVAVEQGSSPTVQNIRGSGTRQWNAFARILYWQI